MNTQLNMPAKSFTDSRSPAEIIMDVLRTYIATEAGTDRLIGYVRNRLPRWLRWLPIGNVLDYLLPERLLAGISWLLGSKLTPAWLNRAGSGLKGFTNPGENLSDFVLRVLRTEILTERNSDALVAWLLNLPLTRRLGALPRAAFGWIIDAALPGIMLDALEWTLQGAAAGIIPGAWYVPRPGEPRPGEPLGTPLPDYPAPGA